MQQELVFYIQLKDGTKADLFAVANASLSLVSLIKEVSYIIDPTIEVKVEIESGTEGSLSLNSIIRFFSYNAFHKSKARIIIIAVSIWFVQEVASYAIQEMIEKLTGNDESSSEVSNDEIYREIQEILKKMLAADRAKSVYEHLNYDENITGFGVSLRKGEKPISIVPRENFQDKWASLPIEEHIVQRVRREEQMLTVVSPILQDSKNKWRFISKDGTIYAHFDDNEFRGRLLSGEYSIPMTKGIVFHATVDIVEEYEDNVWVIKERRVKKVLSVSIKHEAMDLFDAKK